MRRTRRSWGSTTGTGGFSTPAPSLTRRPPPPGPGSPTRWPAAGRCCWSTRTSRPPVFRPTSAPSSSDSDGSPKTASAGAARHLRRRGRPRPGAANGWHLAGTRQQPRADQPRDVPRPRHPRRRWPVVGAVGRARVADRLPGDYVADQSRWVTPPPSTAAQGCTVDTSHTVVTPTTGADALYVGMSRGRDTNIAYVTTRALPSRRPRPARSARAVTGRRIRCSPQRWRAPTPSSPPSPTAVESETEAHAVRTPGELLADAAELATAGRTARWLDQLVDDGPLTPDERRPRGRGRRGHAHAAAAPRRAGRPRPGGRSCGAIAGRSRRATAHQRPPPPHHRGPSPSTLSATRYAEWVPQWKTRSSGVPRHARSGGRRPARGARRGLAEETPQWATEAFGERRRRDGGGFGVGAGRAVAAHRELTGHDDPATALGPPPKAGQTEAYASWRAAWRALGGPRPTATSWR